MKSSVLKVFRRIKRSLEKNGLKATTIKFYGLIADYAFDIKYKTDTCSWKKLDDLTIESNYRGISFGYQPTRVVPLRKLFKKIESLIPSYDGFVDFGCGKGRPLLIAAEFGFRKAIGVDFAHELCEIAKNNCAVYKRKTGTKTEFRILISDAADYSINNDENVFYMYNPCKEIVLKKIIDNIQSSIHKQPRRILIIYHNPQPNNVIEQQDNFVKSGEFFFWGHNFAIYTNEL